MAAGEKKIENEGVKKKIKEKGKGEKEKKRLKNELKTA